MDLNPNPDPDPGHFYKIYWIFLAENNFQIFCFIFLAYFYPKTWWIIQKWGNFYNLFFSKVQILDLEVKKVFCSFLLIFYPLDPDPDPGSQNLANPMDPDSKHCL